MLNEFKLMLHNLLIIRVICEENDKYTRKKLSVTLSIFPQNNVLTSVTLMNANIERNVYV